MPRIISLFLCISILASVVLSSASCTSFLHNGEKDNADAGQPSNTPETPEPDSEPDDQKITLPPYRDYGRQTIDFDKIEYARPDVDALISAFSDVTSAVSLGELSYTEQLEIIRSLEGGYTEFETMYAYANISNSIDTSDAKWTEEIEILDAKSPSLRKAVEELFVAAANSEHAENFEKDYFGEGLIEEYKDGGSLTEKLVSLLEREQDLENDFTSLSTATVVINYGGKRDTVDAILQSIEKNHGADSEEYKRAVSECTALYKKEYGERAVDIYVDLIRLRKEIAFEYGYASYSTVAYDELGHGYSEKQLINYLDDIAMHILPLYDRLRYHVFYKYLTDEYAGEVSRSDVINTTYEAVSDMDADFAEVYSYMLQHKLYNYEISSPDRFGASFTTYLKGYNAPFLFINAVGNVSDYSTVSHEFGHFFDNYVNFGLESSLDLAEVSSTALEMLLILELEDDISDEAFKYLRASSLDAAMQALIVQGFIALFEHYAYALTYDEINEENLSHLLKIAAEQMGINPEITLEAIVIPHTVIYPFYVQSYATSIAASFDIYFLEKENDGAGIEAYKNLVLREDGGTDFVEELLDSGIASPFDKFMIKELAGKIYYDVTGASYYKDSSGKDNAA